MKPNTILIVEDEYLMALSLRRQLGIAGFKVLGVAATGSDALSCFALEEPDLVILDIELIGLLNGVDVAIEIRKRSSCRILFLTGYADISGFGDLSHLGKYEILFKPITAKAIISYLQDNSQAVKS